eukprot:gene9947-2268_t
MIGESLTSKIELGISCKSLIKLDLLSASDPQVFVYEMNKKQKKWNLVGKTEQHKDEPNPQFKKTFMMDFKFEETQELKFLVLDVDSKSTKFEDHDIIGELSCTLSEIIGSRGSLLTKPLEFKEKPNRKNGFISVRADEIREDNHDITVQFSCKNLDKKDFFGKSDPYLIISKLNSDGSTKELKKTETLTKNLNPQFKPFFLTSKEACNGDLNKKLRIECYDWDRFSEDDLIGRIDISFSELLNGGTSKRFPLINDKLKKKRNYKNSGELYFGQLDVMKHPTFLDYIMGGQQISLAVAIDFTASNGSKFDKDSLHYFEQNSYNEYQKALISVGNILNYYDSDKQYPVFGFGAKINGTTSHCFPCNFNPNNPEVFGVAGILDAYNYALNQVTFFGPTYFAPFLKQMNLIASNNQQTYHVLLILTDGEITDMDATIDEIVKASNLPVSIIIIGVGNESFEKMVILDGDDSILKDSNGDRAKRDIVQFVPFKKFRNASLDSLASEVLQEVPGQLLEYMKRKNIKPNQRVNVDPNVMINQIQQGNQQNQQNPQIINLQQNQQFPQ